MLSLRMLFFSGLLLLSSLAYSAVRLPRLISDGMVLQRNAKTNLWGWALPGEKVTVIFQHQTFAATTGKEGRWTISLPAQPAGGPYDIIIAGTNSITVKDVLFGDVWLCSGQSNMELTMSRVQYRYPQVIAAANNSFIRQFEVPDRYNFSQPEADLPWGKWIPANKENILSFSAVAYFFALEIYEKYQVPIGLINAALGGSPAEAWISKESLRQFPDYYSEAQKFADSNLIKEIETHDKTMSNNWYSRLNQADEGIPNQWAGPTFNDAAWDSMRVPGYWADAALGMVNGSVWFRKNVDVPPAFTQTATRLLLGRIVDADSVFVNGRFVGTTSYQYPPRIYDLPAGLLQPTNNQIAIKVISNGGKGGFVPDKPYALVAGNDTLDIGGYWKYKLGATMEPMPPQTVVRWKPTGLYNGMIAPLLPYTIKGALWYQGESNAGHPDDYKALMQTLINDWRNHWQQGAFPFIYVQLPEFMEATSLPAESNWAALRQAQLTTLSVPHTAMAVALGLGEWNDIHPLNKAGVGKRLALQAMQLAYGEKNGVYSGPVFRSVKKAGNQLLLSFSHTGSGLQAVGSDSLHHFAIAGKDKQFVWAQARIQNNQVVVWNEAIDNPVYVRYAWADNPQDANLYNKEGLPASPFEASVP